MDGYSPPADAFPRLDEAERIAGAEAFFARPPGLDLRHGGTAASYAPATDHVQLPAFVDFREPAGYYGTLAHKARHWTGHPARLARDLTGRFGLEAYAAEELVAELGAPSCWPPLASRRAALRLATPLTLPSRRVSFKTMLENRQSADWSHPEPRYVVSGSLLLW